MLKCKIHNWFQYQGRSWIFLIEINIIYPFWYSSIARQYRWRKERCEFQGVSPFAKIKLASTVMEVWRICILISCYRHPIYVPPLKHFVPKKEAWCWYIFLFKHRGVYELLIHYNTTFLLFIGICKTVLQSLVIKLLIYLVK